jgi:hypothetical protein
MKRGRITLPSKSENDEDEAASLQVGTISQLTDNGLPVSKPKRKKGEKDEPEKLERIGF